MGFASKTNDLGRKSTRMRVLVIGGSGLVGGMAAEALENLDCQVLRASRSAELSVDVKDPQSITALFERVGPVDAVVTAVGSAPYRPFPQLTREDFVAGYYGKVQSQVDVVRIGHPYVADGGSFTLTTGILAREPIRTGVAGSVANGALEAFVMAAATELPRGIRINTVSPSVLTEATSHHSAFPGFATVPGAAVGQAYVKAVMGVQTGRVFALDGP
jgi:NAD(P)-dependent dehydrogenase (short-subunit alcohol dehydrogenase family)